MTQEIEAAMASGDFVDPLLSEKYFEHPEQVLAELRENDPVHYVPGFDVWVVTRYEDVHQLFTDPRVSNDPRAYAHYQPAPEGSYLRWLYEHGFFSSSLTAEEHARLRRLFSATMTPRGVQRLQRQVGDVVEQFASKLRGRTGTVDLFREFTYPIPNTVISRIMGISPKEKDESRFRETAFEVLNGMNPRLDEEARKRSDNATLELCEWVRTLAEERRLHPREDIISDLVRDNHEGDAPASAEEVIMTVGGLITAGSETTTVSMTMGLRTLFRNPEVMELLRREPEKRPAAVRELLRYDLGTIAIPRYPVEDFELHGKQLRKGQMMLLNLLGAHRDPKVFPDPDRFDIERDNSKLAVFGHGPHYCLGANLALLELGIMLDAVLDFLPENAKLPEDQIGWQRNGIFNQVTSLPVSLD